MTRSLDNSPPLPPISLGPLDGREGPVGRRVGILPLSVAPIDAASKEERRLRALVGDRGQCRPQPTHLPSRNAASVFSPVLARRLVLGYTDRGDLILDPFAGGGTRAIMTAQADRRYVGVDVNEREVHRVTARIGELGLADRAAVHHADAATFDWSAPAGEGAAALVLTCPPYWCLERYTDQPGDLSRAPTYQAFLDGITAIIQALAPALRRDAFATWVVGRVAHPVTGDLLDLPGDIETVHRGQSYRTHDRLIVRHARSPAVNRIGQFERTRRATRAHEEIVVTRYLPSTSAPARARATLPTPTEAASTGPDPFAGTARLLGTAATLGRRAVGYEIDPELLPMIEANIGTQATVVT